MIEIYKLVGQAAATRATVLIRGESGTGKELIARAIHAHSRRGGRALRADQLRRGAGDAARESELFGHVRGAFTGAHGRSPRQVRARRPRDDLPRRDRRHLGSTSRRSSCACFRSAQFHPVGADRPERTEARVIAATHRDLEAMVAAGQFREDLYYRLRVVEIALPPLRERAGDLPLLAATLVRRAAAARGTARRRCSRRRAGGTRAARVAGQRARAGELPDARGRRGERRRHPRRAPRARWRREPDGPAKLVTLDEMEREHVLRVLAATRGHKARAAQILGISRPRLDRILARHDIAAGWLTPPWRGRFAARCARSSFWWCSPPHWFRSRCSRSGWRARAGVRARRFSPRGSTRRAIGGQRGGSPVGGVPIGTAGPRGGARSAPRARRHRGRRVRTRGPARGGARCDRPRRCRRDALGPRRRHGHHRWRFPAGARALVEARRRARSAPSRPRSQDRRSSGRPGRPAAPRSPPSTAVPGCLSSRRRSTPTSRARPPSTGTASAGWWRAARWTNPRSRSSPRRRWRTTRRPSPTRRGAVWSRCSPSRC